MTQMSMCVGVDTELFKEGEALRRDYYLLLSSSTKDNEQCWEAGRYNFITKIMSKWTIPAGNAVFLR